MALSKLPPSRLLFFLFTSSLFLLLTVILGLNFSSFFTTSSPLSQAKAKLLSHPFDAYLDLYEQALLAADFPLLADLEAKITLLLPSASSSQEDRFRHLLDRKEAFNPSLLARGLDLLNQELEKNPDSVNLWIEKAQKHWLLGQKDEAIKALEKAKELDPVNSTVETILLRER